MPALRFAAGKLTARLLRPPARPHRRPLHAGFPCAPNTCRAVLLRRAASKKGESLTDPRVFTPFVTDTGLTLRRHTLDMRVAQATPAAIPGLHVRPGVALRLRQPARRHPDRAAPGEPAELPDFPAGNGAVHRRLHRRRGAPPFVARPNGSWVYNTAPSKPPFSTRPGRTTATSGRPPTELDDYTPVGAPAARASSTRR